MLARFQNVSRNYGPSEGVFDLSFQLEANQKIGLLGLNGSGKTTTMKLLTGLLLPDRGAIEVKQLSPRQARAWISYLSDKPGFDSWMKPKEIAKFMNAFYSDFDLSEFSGLCDRFQLTQRPIGTMSRGQQQCLRLAAVFSRRVPLYILDEPLSGIDVVSRELIVGMLSDKAPSGRSLLISTHEIKELEDFLDRILVLKKGHLVVDESKEQACQKSSSLTQRFIDLHR